MKCNCCEVEGALHWTVGGFSIYRCPKCDLVYADSSGVDLKNVYEEDYYKKVYPDYESDREVHNRNHEAMLNSIERLVKRGRMLEIGSAFGFFLDCAAKRGWETTGYESSVYASMLAKTKYGVNVLHENFIGSTTGGRYNCACIFDTIEHVADPSAVIAKVASVLNPGGYLFITTGDIASPLARIMGSRWRMVQPPLHLYYFSPGSMTCILEKHGFSIVSVRHDGKYQDLGSIARHIFRMPKRHLPRRMVRINLGDIMTVTARLNPAGHTERPCGGGVCA